MAFAITFILIIIAVASLGKALTKIADFAALGLVNKIMGGVFALAKSVVILSVVFVFFSRINTAIPFVEKETLDNSILYAPVRDMVPFVFPSIIKEFDFEESTVL